MPNLREQVLINMHFTASEGIRIWEQVSKMRQYGYEF
jgi:hypothetical protein